MDKIKRLFKDKVELLRRSLQRWLLPDEFRFIGVDTGSRGKSTIMLCVIIDGNARVVAFDKIGIIDERLLRQQFGYLVESCKHDALADTPPEYPYPEYVDKQFLVGDLGRRYNRKKWNFDK